MPLLPPSPALQAQGSPGPFWVGGIVEPLRPTVAQQEIDGSAGRISRCDNRSVARRGSLTNLLYSLARASATGRAASKGPEALAKREVRRRVYRAEGKATRRIFKSFGL